MGEIAGILALAIAGLIMNNKFKSENNIAENDDYETLVKSRFNNVDQANIVKSKRNRSLSYGGQSKNANIDDSVFTIDNSIDNNIKTNQNSPPLIDDLDMLTNNEKFEANIKSNSSNNNTWINQLDPLTFDNSLEPVSSNNIHASKCRNNANIARIEMQRNMELDGGFSSFDNSDGTYGIISPNSSNFTHSNMNPFIRKGYSPIHTEKQAEVHNRKVELFTGSSDNVDWRPKNEQGPLFSPIVNATNIFGMQSMTDDLRSKYYIGKEKRNELPFKQEQITPGVGIGYNEVGRQGYHDTYRIIPRSTNELRTANNPKVSHGSYVGPGLMGEKGPVLGRVVQYKPDKFREYDSNNMVSQRACVDAPSIYGKYDPKNLATVNRGTKQTLQIGHAYSQNEKNTPGKFRGNYRESSRENYLYDHPRNVTGYESFNGQGHNNNSMIPHETNRNQETNIIGNVSGNAGTNTINYNDVPFLTMRNIHENDNHSGVISRNIQQTKAINFNDVPNTTLRSIFNIYDRSGNVTGNKSSEHCINFNDVPQTTMRNIHGEFDRVGGAYTAMNEYRNSAVNYNDVPNVTLRNIHDNFDRNGNITGEENQYISINFNDIPSTTLRNVHNNYDRSGQLNPDKYSYSAINYDDIPNITMRDIVNAFDRTGQLSGNKQSSNAINYDDIPNITLRDIYNKYDRTGTVKGNKNKGTAVNYNDIPDVTLRNIHNSFDRSGILQGNKEQQCAINYNDVPQITFRNIHNEPDRTGEITSNKYEHYSIDYNDVPTATMRNIHEEYDRNGNVSGEKNTGIAINYNDVPHTTMRNLNPGEKLCVITGNTSQQGSRHQYTTMMINAGKEAIEFKPKPTQCGPDKGWTIENTGFHLKEIPNANWKTGPGTNAIYKNEHIDSLNTRESNEKFYVNTRLLSHTEENLNGNPYINNLIHKSV